MGVQPYAGSVLDCAERGHSMEMAEQKPVAPALTLARHAAGMALVALTNPLIYYDSNPLEAWAITLFGAIIIASALFGILALIQPARAKQSFPKSLITASWLILVLMVLSKWQDYRQQPALISSPPATASQPSEIDEFLRDAPPQKSNNPFSDPNFGKELLPK